MKPIVVVNFKTYKQGANVLKLAKDIEKVDKRIILGVQATDIYEVSKKVKNPIYSQHVDWQKPGRYTGFVLPEAVKIRGAKGVFLNHSEHRLPFSVLKKTMDRCNILKLKTLVFVEDLVQSQKIKKLNPDYLVIEPPELVAGKNSISKSKPELIEKISKKLGKDFLVGAGIKDNEDVKIAMKLGASGIAVSSAIINSKNPKKKLRELLK